MKRCLTRNSGNKMRTTCRFSVITILVALLLITTVTSSFASRTKIYIVTSTAVFLSENDGKSWNSLNSGLPEECRPVRLYTAGNDIYLSTYSSGIFRLEKNQWQDINSSDFRRRSIYNKDAGYRKISAFSVDPENRDNLLLATKHTLYRSRDGGKKWEKVPMKGFNKRNYITAAAISDDRIIVGTAFNGIYESSGNGFKTSGNGLPAEPYSETLKFTAQTSYLYMDKSELYTGFQFGGGLYSKSLNSQSFKPAMKAGEDNFNSIVFDIKKKDGKIYFSDGKNIRMKDGDSIKVISEYNEIVERISEKEDIINALIIHEDKVIPSLVMWIDNPEQKPGIASASSKKAIYVSIPSIQRNLQKYIDMANSTEINAFVIDMKDDFGNIYFPTENSVAMEIKALRKPLNLKSILNKLKSNEIYAIARIVTFKDQKLFYGYNGRYTIKNKNTARSWKGVDGEFWVDPYSEFVQNYNIEIAKELEKAGFNEIQFDYIRFPSDGPINLCNFSFQNDNDSYKSEILIDFLKKAKSSLTIPVSVDIYGFNSWYYFGNLIGQDMEDLSYTVDVICPMIYPSHFGNSFYKKYDREKRPYRIVRDSGIRAEEMVNRRVRLRPYLQAFNLLSPTWGPGYIKDQIKASEESGCSGYTLWNAKGEYDIPLKALKVK